MTTDEIRAWKQQRAHADAIRRMDAQPAYERIVRLGPRRWAFTVRGADGSLAVHELAGRVRLDGSA